MEDPEQPFAAFVLETLTRRSAELGQWWAERSQLVPPESGEPSAAEYVVRTLLDAADAADGDGQREYGDTQPVVQVGWAIGTTAHRHNVSLHQLHEGLDLLTATLLEAAGQAAGEHGGATGRDGLALARQIVGTASVLRVAACSGYTQAVEDELRERYRAIRHDLRNPLGTLKSAIALLTDETLPADTRQTSHVRAMAVRNARSLDRMISEALGDDAAHLNAFETPRELTTRAPADSPAGSSGDSTAANGGASGASDREQRDDVARARQRPDLEPGAL